MITFSVLQMHSNIMVGTHSLTNNNCDTVTACLDELAAADGSVVDLAHSTVRLAATVSGRNRLERPGLTVCVRCCSIANIFSDVRHRNNDDNVLEKYFRKYSYMHMYFPTCTVGVWNAVIGGSSAVAAGTAFDIDYGGYERGAGALQNGAESVDEQ